MLNILSSRDVIAELASASELQHSTLQPRLSGPLLRKPVIAAAMMSERACERLGALGQTKNGLEQLESWITRNLTPVILLLSDHLKSQQTLQALSSIDRPLEPSIFKPSELPTLSHQEMTSVASSSKSKSAQVLAAQGVQPHREDTIADCLPTSTTSFNASFKATSTDFPQTRCDGSTTAASLPATTDYAVSNSAFVDGWNHGLAAGYVIYQKLAALLRVDLR